ncbi:hypothetical protein GCM10010185_42500 [Saccharothrix coeruleofusca]|uniref:Uncharacterized protein n=1 Tax=Saccharothrix coeruleofusca TaxID=33919 RepID=A0A918APJ3_9PSEU|nr:hypothetical protein GCM10010185_42500 [Saccharothrix coeruleofusca]
MRGAARETERVGDLCETVVAGATREQPQHGCGSFDRLDGARHAKNVIEKTRVGNVEQLRRASPQDNGGKPPEKPGLSAA